MSDAFSRSEDSESILNDVLSDITMGVDGPARHSFDGAGNYALETLREPGYSGEIDYRLRQLSYSSLLTLHSCPRKYQLYRYAVQRADEGTEQGVTFSFGHVVGEGIQLILQNLSIESVIFKMMCMWHAPSLFSVSEKYNKSFWSAVTAVQKFAAQKDLLLPDYELVWHKGKPACELSFVLNLPDGFRFRGSVDAVLRHRITEKIIVLECKTTGRPPQEASYLNSFQGIGYSVILDNLFPELSAYDVLYLPYDTQNEEYVPMAFTKTYVQRASWIRQLLMDVEIIKMYASNNLFPIHGESCRAYNRDCEYLHTCTLSDNALLRNAGPDSLDAKEYDVTISLMDLLDTQIKKLSTEPL